MVANGWQLVGKAIMSYFAAAVAISSDPVGEFAVGGFSGQR
jgi:hypothetical protein